MSFFQKVMAIDDETLFEEVNLASIISAIIRSPKVCSISKINIRNKDWSESVSIIFENYHFQIYKKQKENETLSDYELIIADNNSDGNGKKRMVILTAKSIESELVEMDCSGMKENVIIDLNREGRRWEGGELNGKPFGFGREYSEEDNLVYEGFVFEGKRVCVGKEWNDDGNNNCLMYEGGYCNGERWGKGTSYDLNGNVDYEGEWMNNLVVDKNMDEVQKNNLIVPITIGKFVIDRTMFNDKKIRSLYFSPLLLRLKRIKIGYRCFKNVREFVLDGLGSLKSVKIGEECFRVGYSKRSDGLFRISNCPKFFLLEIGKGSFRDYKTIELLNLPSLRSIEFENKYFKHVRRFVIDGLDNLENVNIGEECFWMEKEEDASGQCQIMNCPNLRQIEIGNKSFHDYKSFEISNVSSLQSMVIGNSCFGNSDLSLKGE